MAGTVRKPVFPLAFVRELVASITGVKNLFALIRALGLESTAFEQANSPRAAMDLLLMAA